MVTKGMVTKGRGTHRDVVEDYTLNDGIIQPETQIINKMGFKVL